MCCRRFNDSLVGVGITISSFSNALRRSNGRLFPFGWRHFIKPLRGKENVVDLLLVAVKPEYQNKGVNSLIFCDLIPIYIKTDTNLLKAILNWNAMIMYRNNGITLNIGNTGVDVHTEWKYDNNNTNI